MAGRARQAEPGARARLPLPKYFVLRNILRERFREWRRGERLPSENELARQFRVTRVTLRRALGGLVQEGLIVRHQGKGTFYAGRDRAKGTQELSGALESLMVYEGGGRAEIVEKVRWAQASPEIAGQLGLRPTDAVVVIKRVGYSEDEPLAYIVNYLPYDIGVKVYDDDHDLERNPMVALLQEKYGIPLTRSVQTIEAVLADAEIAERLGIFVGTAVLQAERIYFSTRGQPIQFTRSWYRADRYKYTVTLRGWKRRRRRGGSRG